MNTPYHYNIFFSADELPNIWNSLANDNIFLNSKYLEILDQSKPENMECHYIGIFQNKDLIGIAISQYLDLNQIQSFQSQNGCLKTAIKRFIFKRFSSHVLFIGNNMLTGQNTFSFKDSTDKKSALQTLKMASRELKKIFKSKGKKIHFITFKDFYADALADFNIPDFKNDYRFSTQPNMVFSIRDNWKTEQDYLNSLSKKYRDQYKRARKKIMDIEKRKMNLDEIIKHEEIIYNLYFHVAENAPFNTFFLAKNHFRVFKEKLKEDFLFYGYFLNGKLVGFNTLIKNGNTIDTYFLGYDTTIQHEKMLYLNMLYDMIAFSINKGYKEIIFARTALEIKSSVGAQPIEMFGFMHHQNRIINKQMDWIFDYFEPKTIWNKRNPFK